MSRENDNDNDNQTGETTAQGPTAQDGTSAAYARGAAMMERIYNGAVPVLPEGTMVFNDVMMRTLFAEVWDRDVLSVRDRRLMLLGVIATAGASEVWRIQATAALANGELTPDELRETLVILAPYAGYPNVASLVLPCEEVIGSWQRSQRSTPSSDAPGPSPDAPPSPDASPSSDASSPS
jgi:4-carboxymuconolactone decarboxylase